ncbi:hypothetical protein BD779DRAFT_1672241 [Infundibulicybe gibba]|nr:hypothetical protein BD779DRAFT_1672241 [Infundibulicybe gibba]
MSSETSSLPAPSNTSVSKNPANDGGFFTPGGSPPLILAFLAVGLFSAAMIAVFGWRRIQFGHRWQNGRQLALAGSRGELPEKPELWDLTTATPAKSSDEVRWHNILPLAALTSDTDPPNPDPPTHSRYAEPHIALEYIHKLVRSSRRSTGDESALPAKHRDLQLQVAVAIAMPSRSGLKNDAKVGSNDGDGLEYSIGLYHRPWQE